MPQLSLHRAVAACAIAACALLAAPPVSAQSSGQSTANDVIEQYVTALGGRDALAKIKTVEFTRERNQFGTVTKVYRIEDVATRRFYQRAEAPDGLQETGFDGSRMWQKRAAFHGYLSEDEMQVRVFRKAEPDIRDYRESGRTYTRLPNETVDSKEYIVVQGTQRQVVGGDVPVKFYFDPATHLLRRKSYGAVVQVVQTWDDYRDVGGVMVPFVTTTDQPQGKVVVRTITHRHNVPVADSLFQFREGGAPKPTGESTASAAPAAGAPGTVLDERLRLATFEYVWQKVNDTYWDSTFGGVDWKAVRDRYRPLALAAQDSKSFHDVLARMVAELHQSHFHVIPPEQVLTATTSAADLAGRRNATPGVELRTVDGRVLVVAVDSGSPAAAAGVRMGYEIVRVGGKAPAELYEAWRKTNADFELKRLAFTQAVADALRGVAGTTVPVELIDERGRTVRVDLGRRRAAVGLAGQYAFEWRRVAPGVGYIHFTIFFSDAVERCRAALDSLGHTRGLVIDLRGNPGGVGAMSRAIASMLSADGGSLGVARFRHETQQFTFAGRGAAAYKGKVVVLVDDHSGSTSEVFAAGLQDLGRATVVGDTTAGAVLPSNADVLPTGGSFQHPISDYHSAKGYALEGRGVIPDVVVRPTRAALLAGRDEALERAVELITR